LISAAAGIPRIKPGTPNSSPPAKTANIAPIGETPTD
jgi:hypothetical protein